MSTTISSGLTSWQLDLLDVVVPEQVAILRVDPGSHPVLVSKSVGGACFGQVSVHPVGLLRPSRVSASDIAIIEVTSQTSVVVTDPVQRILEKAQISQRFIDHILDNVDQVELVSSPQNHCNSAETSSKQNIPFSMSSERVNAMETSVLAISRIIDQLRLIVQSHRRQKGISVLEVPLLGSAHEERIPIDRNLQTKPSAGYS